MKSKALILLALALGCGLVAMLGVQQLLNNKQGPVKEETVPVLVAVQDINPGLKLDETQVAFKDWPKAQVPPGAVTTKEEIEDRCLKVPVYSGEVILTAKLSEKGITGAAASIPAGMRVVSVPINMTAIHSGMVRPGDRVDIICTYKTMEKGELINRSRPVLEYVEVFAMDRQRHAESNGEQSKGAKFETLSLLCTPQQMALIELAASKGSLQMALRGKNDPPKGEKPVMYDDKLFENQALEQGAEKSAAEELTGTPNALEQALQAEQQTAEKQVEKAPEATPVAVEEPAPPAPEYWVIKIYEGGNLREEKIELHPDGTTTAIATAAAEHPATADVTPALPKKSASPATKHPAPATKATPPAQPQKSRKPVSSAV